MAIRYISLLLLVITWFIPFLDAYAAKKEKPSHSLTVATVPSLLSALLFLAQEEGIFSSYNLDVSLKSCETDFDAFEMLFQGKADFATTTEFIAARKAFASDEFKIVTTLAQANIYRIVAAQRAKISKPTDLKGKTIGLRYTSIAEFYLHNFLLHHGIAPEGVTTREMNMDMAAEAIATGRIDAAFVLEPYYERFRKKMDLDLIVFPGQLDQDFFWLLVTSNSMVSRYPQVVKLMLTSLSLAQDYLRDHPEEAREKLARSLGLSAVSLRNYTFFLALDQELILTLENQARWIQKYLFSGEELPNFLQYFYFDALQDVKPGSVTIFH